MRLKTKQTPLYYKKKMMKMVAREGYLLIGISLLLCAVLAFVGVKLGSYLGTLLIVAGAFLVVFVTMFFRDPQRTAPEEKDNELLVVAPADGKVVLIKEIQDDLYIKGPARQLSIFLSVFNVHVNRIPVSGVVEYCRYIPGDYLVAWHPKASEKNERSEFGVKHKSGVNVLFKQIAGAVARRIVYYIDEGDEVKAGDRFGVVKFGSRMDVIVPIHVHFEVNVGDAVKAGETVLIREKAFDVVEQH